MGGSRKMFFYVFVAVSDGMDFFLGLFLAVVSLELL